MELKDQFRCKTPELCSQVSMKTLYTDYNIGNMKDQDFEFIVLESALENIINKFKKLNFPQHFSFLSSSLHIMTRSVQDKEETLTPQPTKYKYIFTTIWQSEPTETDLVILLFIFFFGKNKKHSC